MNVYLLVAEHRLYMVFGTDAVAAGEVLGERLGLNPKFFSVGGHWAVDPNEPIDVSSLWGYFTNTPGRHADP